MKTALYRIIEFCTAVATRPVMLMMAKEVHGNGSLLLIPGMLKESGKKKVFVITTSGTIRRGTLTEFFEKLESNGIGYEVFSDVCPDPTVECVEAAAKAYKDAECDSAVAVGGGSVMDCAKVALARVVCPKKPIRKMKGLMKVHHKIPDLYAVPTTAGTGSETTVAAVITDTVDGRHYKYAVSDMCLIPKYAVLDPSLTFGLPAPITATTGMDALTHAVEAYTNCFASFAVKRRAIQAVNLIYENLPRAYQNGQDIEARKGMLIGSFYAGIAFTNNFVGYVHAIAHAVGALYGIAHGEANAIILPVVLEEFGQKAEHKLAKLAKAAGIQADSERELAIGFIESIRNMNRSMGIPEKLAQLKAEDFEIIAERAFKEGVPAYPTPVIWTREDFKHVLEKLMA